jgi:hypothetical protein
MVEITGIVTVRRPEGTRWNDGAVYWYGVHVVDREAQAALYEEAPVEDIQSYGRFQCSLHESSGCGIATHPRRRP